MNAKGGSVDAPALSVSLLAGMRQLLRRQIPVAGFVTGFVPVEAKKKDAGIGVL
jgi:hypothetical protein